jgi:hypothetical protein
MPDEVPVPAPQASPAAPAPPPPAGDAERPAGSITRHFRWLRRLPLWAYLPIVVVEINAFNLLFSWAFGLLTGDPTGLAARDDLPKAAGELFLSIVIWAPILETLLCQALPIEMMRAAERRYRSRLREPIIVSMVFFTIGHFGADIATIVVGGIVGGFYLAFTYAHWRSRSVAIALLATAICHAAWNLVPFLGLLAAGSS